MSNQTAAAAPVAQITICGSLGKEHVAALVEVAIAAGAGLVVQPRTLPAAAAIVEAPRALPAAPLKKRVARRAAAKRAPAAIGALTGPDVADVRGYLSKHGPVAPREFRQHFKLSAHGVRAALNGLEARGVVELTGKTFGRRVGLPGQAAKEAP